jgi:hypothetical protein
MLQGHKIGVVIFHRNIDKIYKQRWVDESIRSILNQTHPDFHIYEINYGGEPNSLIEDYGFKNHIFYQIPMENYAEAMNFIITKSFEDGCDYVFNTNLDDLYSPERIEKQLQYIQEGEYDLISCDFLYVEEFLEEDKEVDRITNFLSVSNLLPNIGANFNFGHNIICHPGVCYNRKFWENNKYDISKVPSEDFELWKKTLSEGYKFGIVPQFLVYYRIHQNQMGSRRIDKKEV